MPSLGADMEEGTLVEWRVKPGDTVRRGDIIAVVHTEKAEIEVEVFEGGVVEKLLAHPGAKLPVGSVLALIRGEAGAPAAAPSAVEKIVSPATAQHADPVTPVPTAPAAESARVRVTPLARKLAAELGVDLNQIQGTGPHGAIDREDVERAAAQAKPPAPAQQKVEIGRAHV